MSPLPLMRKGRYEVGVDVHERAAATGSPDHHPAVIAAWRARDKADRAKGSSKKGKIVAWRKAKARLNESVYVRRYLNGEWPAN